MQPVNVPRGLAVTALLVVVLWGAAQGRPFLVPLSVAALLAFMMAPLVRLLVRVRVPELLAITISALALVLPCLGLIYALIRQGQAFVGDLPNIIMSLEDQLRAFSRSAFAQRLGLGEFFDPFNITKQLGESAGQGVTLVISGLGAVLSAGSQLALVLLFSVLMLASRRRLRHCAEQVVSRNKRFESKQLINDVSTLIQRFLVARLSIAFMIAAVDFAILAAFQVKYSFLLATFLGVMTLVPAIGYLISVIPPIFVSIAMGHSLLSTLFLFGALTGVSAIENYFLTPKLVGGRLNINALATFVGLFAGGLLWGIWGMLLSVPILGVIRIVFSALPSLQPWGELLADKPNGHPSAHEIRQHPQSSDEEKRLNKRTPAA